MDSSTDINQDPLTAGDSGATSFATDFDMSAINEAVAAGPEADTVSAPDVQTAVDVNDINLDNTPTTDAELQAQLNGGASPMGATAPAAAPEAPKAPVAGFVDGDLSDDDPVVARDTAPVATPDFDSFNATESANINIAPEPIEEPVAEEATIESDNLDASEAIAPEAPAGPATIADLANAAPVAEPATEPVAEPAPAPAPAPATPSFAPSEPKGRSKIPTFILLGLAAVALVAVIIAVVVSLG